MNYFTMKNNQTIKNMICCPYFDRCNRDLCPLDFELSLRSGRTKCRWMREPEQKKIGNKNIISGGSVMPDNLLIYVPEENIKKLNSASQKRVWNIAKKSVYIRKNHVPVKHNRGN